jgi:hypothetical protein
MSEKKYVREPFINKVVDKQTFIAITLLGPTYSLLDKPNKIERH